MVGWMGASMEYSHAFYDISYNVVYHTACTEKKFFDIDLPHQTSMILYNDVHQVL